MTGNKLQQTKPDRAIAPLSAILNYYHQFNFIKPAVYASMLTMQYYIISVTPSEDIILKIQNLRTSIYRKFGLVSARALPVMIPVGFSDTRIDQDIFSDIIRRGFISTRNRAETRGNDIFLSLENTFFLEEIKKLIPKTKKPTFFNILPGFYLCTLENQQQTLSETVSYINSQIEQRLKWEKNHLELIKIELENKNWWEALRWETLWEKKFRQ